MKTTRRSVMRMKRRAWIAAAAAVGVLGIAPAGGAVAKISPAQCQTSSGQLPPGQQPTCQGGGLQQQPAENPAGHAPPGQQ
ncbi:MAG: hypothetical protein JSS99_08060 [Actinobacteria bacterium]|nr:hypothetical protein [Actinomycetota bacterium]